MNSVLAVKSVKDRGFANRPLIIEFT